MPVWILVFQEPVRMNRVVDDHNSRSADGLQMLGRFAICGSDTLTVTVQTNLHVSWLADKGKLKANKGFVDVSMELLMANK